MFPSAVSYAPSHRPCHGGLSTVAPSGRNLTVSLVLMLSVASGASGQQRAPRDPSPHSDIALVSDVASAAPGSSITVAARLTLDPGWHTYWTNPGDAGLPLTATWALPAGMTVGPLRFPTPRLAPQAPLMSYGYEGEVFVLATVTIPSDAKPGSTIHLVGKAEWLACAEQCLPASGDLALDIPIRAEANAASTQWARAIASTRARLPVIATAWTTRGWYADSAFTLIVVPPTALAATLVTPYLFVDSANVVDHAAVQQIARSGDTTVIVLHQSAFATEQPSRIRGVLVPNTAADSPSGWTIDVPIASRDKALATRAAALLASANVQRTGGVSGTPSEGTAGSGSAAGITAAQTALPEPSMSLIAALAFAFIGGLILNLMPCVFPVLSVKVLSLLQHSGASPSHSRKHGLAFGAGVLASFWILAGTLMALRAGGEQLGWGFQLQSPTVVALLALLLFALGLNLSGVFEIGLSLTRLGAAGSGSTYRDSVLTGLLAVLVAAPCTAPFMGAALGYALVQPAIVGMLVFTALGIGLALPFVVLTSVPALLRFLPRPGPWLETLKQLFAFPLYATVVWLLWVLGQQIGVDGLAIVLLAMILLALGAWVWARGVRLDRGAVRGLAALLMTGAVAASISGATTMRVAPLRANTADGWEPYSAQRVQALRAEGRAIFIDFTAAWCLSCQVNERVALRTAAVKEAFAKADVALLRADWTSRDSSITAVLASFGRSGVPLYVLYPRSLSENATVLPAVLSPGIVVEAIRAATSRSLTAQLTR
jgi:thiol:disulfide interchange protein